MIFVRISAFHCYPISCLYGMMPMFLKYFYLSSCKKHIADVLHLKCFFHMKIHEKEKERE